MVGTMTELNDHLKLLFARSGQLFDRQSAQPVRHDTPETIYAELLRRSAERDEPRLVLTFPVELPANTSAEQLEQWLSASGFTRVQAEREEVRPVGARTSAVPGRPKQASAPSGGSEPRAAGSVGMVKVLDVVADRFRIGQVEKGRVVEAIEVALKRGAGRLNVYVMPAGAESSDSELWRFSSGLHCPDSDLRYTDPIPSAFSFNSAVGACEACRGFGRVIGVDYGLVIPNDKLTLRAGAIKPMQTPAWKECQDDLMRHAETAGIPRDTPWNKLTPEQQGWVINGSPNWNGKWNQHWYGVKRFFEYLETKSYKMHIRVLLSKYRSYTPCGTCGGARLKTESLLWRIGSKADADAVMEPAHRFMPEGVAWTRAQLEALPGLCLHDLMLLPLDRLRRFFESMTQVPNVAANEGETQALKLLFEEITTRLKYLCDVGIGYLTLDRQSRTLSGGEVQRINLTTALGTSLVNTLFVLDEPSIGLHPRDMHRIIKAMQRLRDAGNTLVVVEHDPAVMLAADRMIDMGPGPGERGGQIVFDGTTEALRSADTLTGAYLGGRKQVGMGFKRMVTDHTPRLILEGAREHNLRNVTVEIPLQRLVCVTGVSGSGKSSLIQDVLAPALMRHFGKATETPGAHDRLLGADHLSEAVFVDQSPIGKTARSNPVSYVGAWDAVREIFATAPLSRQRGYTASKFSFNSGDGRCPTCGGSGFEHVEMQFLSDVYLRCPDCDGKRYRPEILEITVERQPLGAVHPRVMNVADVLDLTVSEAAAIFANDREVIRALQPIVDVGLEYVKLGQPVPTLSGGEAQRLKLAGFLAEAAKSASASRQPTARKGTLFLFDEPTTGLHFDDIAKLMRALRKLLDAGHSLVVIEHNLDVIRASDWLIDLGPEGGDAGGLIVAQGTPEEVRLHATSHTGQALREYDRALGMGSHRAEEGVPLQLIARARRQATVADNAIQIINAREHNLKNAQRGHPTRQVQRHHRRQRLGQIHAGLRHPVQRRPAALSRDRSTPTHAASCSRRVGPRSMRCTASRRRWPSSSACRAAGARSTVGTTTEVWHFLRLLYVKLGVQHCVHDGAAVQPQTPERIAAQIMTQLSRPARLVCWRRWSSNRKGVYTELADWARPRGFTHLRVDGEFLPTTELPAHRPLQGTHDRAARPELARHARATRRSCANRSRTPGAWQGRGACAARSGRVCATRCMHGAQSAARIGQAGGVLDASARARVCSTSIR
jgi:excinuclease ABC subunit A